MKRIHVILFITTNYFTAAAIGLLLTKDSVTGIQEIDSGFLFMAGILGALFIVMFLLIQHSIEHIGMSKTSVASKVSVVLPVMCSLIIDKSDHLTTRKAIAITLLILCVILVSYSKEESKISKYSLLLPLLTFLGMGLVDSVVKVSQYFFLTPSNTTLFSSLVFLFSFLWGVLFLFFRKRPKLDQIHSSLFLGFFLGLCNFGSLYFFIRSLQEVGKAKFMIDGSSVYAINNIGIIVFCSLIGFSFFKERISFINLSGILLSILGVYLIF